MATPVGAPLVVFDPGRDACDGHDVADVPLRAYRGADGRVHAFALHYENRRMSGKSLRTLKVECPVAFRGSGNGDPARYDDRAWIAATWTTDGRTVHALAHHEFQANQHKGRCAFPEYIRCWWNSVLNLRSTDGGRSFSRAEPRVAVAAPFPSEHDQGRHRGFFNPSNIIRKDEAFYTLIGTTGWKGQPSGVCLFRTHDPASGSWRGLGGQDLGSKDLGSKDLGSKDLGSKGFDARFPDPYAGNLPGSQRCRPLAPFPAPVGGMVRHRGSGQFLAVFQAQAGSPDGAGGQYAQSGFYLAASPDLVTWSAPTLVLATRSFYDNACGAGTLRNYPVLIDENSRSRNFEDIGDEALLFYSETRVDGCTPTSDRKLIARKVRISTYLRP